MTNTPKPTNGQSKERVSNCCGAVTNTCEGEEGTNYFQCGLCRKPCDAVSKDEGHRLATRKGSVIREIVEENGEALFIKLLNIERAKYREMGYTAALEEIEGKVRREFEIENKVGDPDEYRLVQGRNESLRTVILLIATMKGRQEEPKQ